MGHGNVARHTDTGVRHSTGARPYRGRQRDRQVAPRRVKSRHRSRLTCQELACESERCTVVVWHSRRLGHHQQASQRCWGNQRSGQEGSSRSSSGGLTCSATRPRSSGTSACTPHASHASQSTTAATNEWAPVSPSPASATAPGHTMAVRPSRHTYGTHGRGGTRRE